MTILEERERLKLVRSLLIWGLVTFVFSVLILGSLEVFKYLDMVKGYLPFTALRITLLISIIGIVVCVLGRKRYKKDKVELQRREELLVHLKR